MMNNITKNRNQLPRMEAHLIKPGIVNRSIRPSSVNHSHVINDPGIMNRSIRPSSAHKDYSRLIISAKDHVRIADKVHFFYGPNPDPEHNDEVTALITDEFLDKKLMMNDFNYYLGCRHAGCLKTLFLVRNGKLLASFQERHELMKEGYIRLRLYLPSNHSDIQCFYGSEPYPQNNPRCDLSSTALNMIMNGSDEESLYVVKKDRLIVVFHKHHLSRINNTIDSFLIEPHLTTTFSKLPMLPQSYFGFIMIRHVRCALTNRYWIHALECIRRFHPTETVLIIDDASTKQHVNIHNVCMDHCHVIDSEFPGAAEILPYYYFHKMRLFERAFIMHDSVFINAPINPAAVKNVRTLWDFGDPFLKHFDCFSINAIQNIIDCGDDDDNRRVLDVFQSKCFRGYFGAMSMMTLDFLDLLVARYHFLKLVPHIAHSSTIRGRDGRMCLERIMACLCHDAQDDIEPALYGHIFDHPSAFSFRFHHYKTSPPEYPPQEAYKVWSGR